MLLLLLAESPFDIELQLYGEDSAEPTLLDVSSFLYDFNLGYELARLATDPQYEGFGFSHFALYRKGRPLKSEDRLRVVKLSHQSPIELSTIISGATMGVAAIWGVVQIVEKVSNWRLNREKLKEEINKLRRENAASKDIANDRIVSVSSEEESTIRFVQSGAQPLLDGVTNRLSRSPVRIKELQIRVVRRRTEIKKEKEK